MLYIIIFIIIILFCIFNNKENYTNNNLKDPCTDYLDDNEYLKHMIPHHQVAIDMSKKLIKITKNPIMIELCRKIIWQQSYEIQMMNSVMNKLPNKLDYLQNNNSIKNYSDTTKLNYYYPKLSKATNYYCDPNFFDPNAHDKHMEGMKLTDKSYLEHMIPHHQVAIDMSNRLLKYTKNIHMIDLATTIIIEQQLEILKMNEMLNNISSWNYNSILI
jgi:uncharacterized protein (DUF305 family)